jgi:hypothetical protein
MTAGVEVAGLAAATDDEIHGIGGLILGENGAALREVPEGSGIGQLAKRGRGKKGEKAVSPKEAGVDLHNALKEEGGKGGGLAEFSGGYAYGLVGLIWLDSVMTVAGRIYRVFFLVKEEGDEKCSMFLSDISDVSIGNSHRQLIRVLDGDRTWGRVNDKGGCVTSDWVPLRKLRNSAAPAGALLIVARYRGLSPPANFGLALRANSRAADFD